MFLSFQTLVSMASTMFKELSLKIREERPSMVKVAGHSNHSRYPLP